MARCEGRRDHGHAIGQVMDWWDREHLGNWSITGPATGWSSFRHRRPAPHVLVDPDPAARELEARAITGGRREVRRDGPPAERPVRRPGHADRAPDGHGRPGPAGAPDARVRQPSPGRAELRSGLAGALAECEVETAAPRYPWRPGRACSIRSAGSAPSWPARSCATRAAGRAALDRARPRVPPIRSMQDWAIWLAGMLDPALTDVPATVRLMAKGWSRSVPGKWAGPHVGGPGQGADGRPGWQVEPAWLAEPHRQSRPAADRGRALDHPRDRWSDDAFPAILAWIQSATRVALGRLVDALGDAVVGMNTRRPGRRPCSCDHGGRAQIVHQAAQGDPHGALDPGQDGRERVVRPQVASDRPALAADQQQVGPRVRLDQPGRLDLPAGPAGR